MKSNADTLKSGVGTGRGATTYRSAGVDIEKKSLFIRGIARLARSTRRPEVLAGIGGFCSAFALPRRRYRRPLLVAGTDGVGTKLIVAGMAGRHDTIGIDLVAMCVNDILVSGAEPLFFLDYFATGRLAPRQAASVMAGIVTGCRQAGCALVGGETAELPSMYKPGEYDLAGFAVGVVERSRLIDGRAIRPGDRLIALASSGFHSNGYSLIRKVIFDQARHRVADRVGELGGRIDDLLLRPTRIYARAIAALQRRLPGRLHGLAHITGGGITENLPRILPARCRAVVDRAAWCVPPHFLWLQRLGRIAEEEMWRVFNMGVGMILVVPPQAEHRVITVARRAGERAFPIGWIERGRPGVRYHAETTG
ncbi:MAG TPA: phosphoribosylformylglycinamidine cyclo-ligase [Nitrospiria bacterium]|nr:phosphoribosylformylglycinamidine cyclo-ligase [Nitrospiria bacterium]